MSTEDRKKLDSFLAEIGAAVGKNIRLNENGISAFTYDHLTFVIEVPENVSSFFIYTTLVCLSRCQEPEAVMRKILLMNYLQQETRGGCIGMDETNDDLIFSYSDRVNEINSTEFRNILENFIDTSLQLSKQLEEVDNGLGDQAGAAVGEDMMAQQMSQHQMNSQMAKAIGSTGGQAHKAGSNGFDKEQDAQTFKPRGSSAIMP